MLCQNCWKYHMILCDSCHQYYCPGCNEKHVRDCQPTRSKRSFEEIDNEDEETPKRRKVASGDSDEDSPQDNFSGHSVQQHSFPNNSYQQNSFSNYPDFPETSMEGVNNTGENLSASSSTFPSLPFPSFGFHQYAQPFLTSNSPALSFESGSSSNSTQNSSQPPSLARHENNTLMQSSAPALGIVTWNMQRLGMLGKTPDLDARPETIDTFYEKIQKFLNLILKQITDHVGPLSGPSQIPVGQESSKTLSVSNTGFKPTANMKAGAVIKKKTNSALKEVNQNFLIDLRAEILKFMDPQDFKTNHRQISEKDRGALYLHLKKYIYLTTRPQSGERKSLNTQLSLYRRLLKIEHIVEMFMKNAWLDVLIMQEVGLGFELMKNVVMDYAAACGIKLKCYSGPLTQSKGGYQEYFAIIVRDTVVVEKCGWSDTGGKIAEFDLNIGCQQIYIYDRDDEGYRPIIFYKLKPPPLRNAESVYVGAVHTTPEGNEFKRLEDYKQINESSIQLRNYAKGQWVIIGGDYYLTAEATVKKLDDPENKFSNEAYKIIKGLTATDEAVTKMFNCVSQIATHKAYFERLQKLLGEYQLDQRYVNAAATILQHLIRLGKTDNMEAQRLVSNIEVPKDSIALAMIQEALARATNLEAYEYLKELNLQLPNKYCLKLEQLGKNIANRGYDQVYPGSPLDQAIRQLEKQFKNIQATIRKIIMNGRKNITIKDTQVPELNRNSAGITFAAAVKNDNWTLCQAVTATNWKEPPISGTADEWEKGRIADFFICSQDWLNAQVGLIIPPFLSPGVVLADSDDLQLSRHWLAISDHIPIAGYFTGIKEDNIFMTQIAKIPSDEKAIMQKAWHTRGYLDELKLEAADYSTYDISDI